ncbi:DJ-1/PfpI family protein [bacterium]|nr:DJ-1/PfpI family protein [bacterium]
MLLRIVFVSVWLWLVTFGIACSNGERKEEHMEKKGKIAMIIAPNDFRDEEYLVPKRIFEEAGYEVVTFSETTAVSIGMLGAKVTPDKKLADLRPEEFDAVDFVGGVGSTFYWDDTVALKVASSAYERGKVVAAICLAPVILANAGLLSGKNATVFKSAKGKLIEKGAKYTAADVEVAGRIITGNGPSAAKKFAEAIIKALEEKGSED